MKFETVKTEDGFAVKTQIRKNGRWYVAAEVFCIPGLGDAKEIANIVTSALNGAALAKKYKTS